MEFQLLGPVEVRAGGVLLDIGSAKQRLVLAALMVAPGRVVPLETVIDRVWGEAPPGQPAATLYPYLSQLRRVLEPAGAGIVRRTGGYSVEVPPDRVDLVRFRTALTAARQADDLTAIELLEEALAPWPGTPLAGLAGSWPDRLRDSLIQDRLSGWLLLAALQHRRGELAVLADRLLAVAEDHRLSEPLAGFVIRALALAGRRAEALDFYARLRDHLTGELGEDPSDELRQLHLRLLRRAPELRAAEASNARVVPRQLPTVTRHFTGRDRELKALDEVLGSIGDAPAGVTSVVAGTAGVGKTALAVHWAQRAAGHFPDGQLFVDLRGFDPVGEPMPTAEALRGFLEALGLPADRVPPGLEDRSTTFRSLLADRRVLVLLDNARDVRHVRPLLPGAAGCMTVVTSRNQLTGLVAEHGAEPLGVDLLTGDEATRLLSRFIGPERIAAEPEAVAELVRRCARLPLALVIAAGRAASELDRELTAVTAELEDTARRLDALETDDPSTTIRTVFASSYGALTPPARRLFRLTGLFPGADLPAVAAAALADTPPAATKRLLSELCRVGLLTQHRWNRYTGHDLIRLFAQDRALDEESADSRQAAVSRLLDHYRQGAVNAMDLYAPAGKDRRPRPPVPDVPVVELADRDAATDWLDAERANLIALAEHAGAHGSPEHVADLSVLLFRYFDAAGRHDEALHLHTEAARVTDGPMRGRVLGCLGTVCWRLGRYDDAVAHFTDALAAHRLYGSADGEGATLTNLGIVQIQQGRLTEAIEHLEQALELHQAAGNRIAEADARGNLSDAYTRSGDLTAALEHSRGQLELARELGHRPAEGVALSNLGTVLRLAGRPDEALTEHERALTIVREAGLRDCEVQVLNGLGADLGVLGRPADGIERHRAALTLATELGNRYEQACAYAGLADCSAALGDAAAAVGLRRQALPVFTALGTPEAATIAAQLAEPDNGS